MKELIIKIRNKKIRIGLNHPVFIIAEMSGNHNQNIERAYKIIDAAAEAGADAIKLQTYTPDTITIDSNKSFFQVKTDNEWSGETLYSLYKKAFTPWEWQSKLFKYANKKGLLCFSTPFDNTAVDFLEKLHMPLYKVASFEVIDIPLLKRIGMTEKPVIISRGMATKKEISLAIKTLRNSGTPAVAVLHCISSYPAAYEEMNLATIRDIKKRFKVIAGLSDHSQGLTASLTAVALGGKIIEKHLTLSRKDGGPDASFSIEPNEFKELVISIRNIEKAIGKVDYSLGKKEKQMIVYRKSLFAVKNIKKGEIITTDNVKSIRPGHGLKPLYYDKILGRRASRGIERGTPIKIKLIK